MAKSRYDRVAVAMLGARMHYAVPRLLYEEGLLGCFYTDSYIGNKPWVNKVLRSIPRKILPLAARRWLGRNDLVIPAEKVQSFEVLGLWYAWARSHVKDHAREDDVFHEAARRFNESVIRSGLDDASILYGFNGASYRLFEVAKSVGVRCVLEQTILPKRFVLKLLKEEIERWPNFEPGLQIIKTGRYGSDWDEKEWLIADCIIAGSEFVRAGLIDARVPAEKIRVIPYGVDPVRFPVNSHSVLTCSNCPLRVLFVGQVGLRKGVPDLLQALRQFPRGKIEARFAGPIMLDRQQLKRAGEGVQFLGAVPRSNIHALLDWADVFVLPSIIEGSATVTYEALMSGVPVITTPNAGSIVRDGVDGFIVPIRDPGAIARSLRDYIEDRAMLQRHRNAAIEGRVRVSIDRYRADLKQLMMNLMNSSD